VVDVPTFARLIPEPSSLEVLAVEEDITLQVYFRVEQMVLVADLSSEIIVDNVEDTSNPERIARVYQFISPAVVASKLGLAL
jgi:hypothetical protein